MLAAGIAQVESDLHATSGLISLSLSLFILIQGMTPLLWSATSEIVGRKVGVWKPCGECQVAAF